MICCGASRATENHLFLLTQITLNDIGVFWLPIYGIGRELEKLFRDVEGITSHIAFIDGYNNLIINDEKLRM